MEKILSHLVDATQATEYIMFDVEHKFHQQVLSVISVMQEGVGYVAFNDESGFPTFFDSTIDEQRNIWAVKANTDEDGHHSLMVIIDDYNLEDIANSESWIYANAWGSYSDSEIFNSLKSILGKE